MNYIIKKKNKKISSGDNMKEVVEKLIELNKTISTMESCTGGALANSITNIEGSSEVFKFGAVTYSNEFKIKMGVDPELIDKYSVYSKEVARDMALKIHKFTNSSIGVGITGKLNRYDKANNQGLDNEVFVSIYYQDNYYDLDLIVDKATRKDNKDYVIEVIKNKLLEVLNENN